MITWLESLPRFVIALMFVVGALVFMYLSEPPQSVCDTQVESTNKYLDKYVLNAKEEGWSHAANIKDKYDHCLKSNSLGGCFSLFERLNKLEKQVRKFPQECATHDGIKEAKNWLFRGMVLMTKIGWGTEMPKMAHERRGWLDDRSFALFCRMKRESSRLFGDETLKKWELAAHKSIQQTYLYRNCTSYCSKNTTFDATYTIEIKKERCVNVNNPEKRRICLCGQFTDKKLQQKCLCQTKEFEFEQQQCRCQLKCADKKEKLEVHKQMVEDTKLKIPTLDEIKESSLFRVICRPYL